jgi:hypothetical protein
MNQKPSVGIDRTALFAVLEQMLGDLAREKGAQERPTKDDLLAYLKSGSKKLNLYFIRTLSPEAVSALRKDPAFSEKLFAALREVIISLHKPLINPLRVRSLVHEAGLYPIAEVRKDPDLWAARVLTELPAKLDQPLPLVDLRLLLPQLQQLLEARVPQAGSIEELDSLYGYIERVLDSTPKIEFFARRALELSEKTSDPGEVVAYYRLLGQRIAETLTRLPPSAEKDKTLLALKEMTGLQDPGSLKLFFKKAAMAKADELMEGARNYEELFELRFFFSQIGERSNKKLLSRKTGELARTLNVRTDGYLLLDRLKDGELDENGLIELVPAVIGKAERFVLNAPLRFLDRLMKFYLETACPLVRRLKNEPEKVPLLIQNFKRQVGLLNIYRDLDHLAEVMQRKMVLAICNPQMLETASEKILRYLTRLPPEFYPPKVMQVLRNMVREKGSGYRFTTADVLRILAAYPPPEEEEEEESAMRE